jgi:glucose/arabinose dehydrogenase
MPVGVVLAVLVAVALVLAAPRADAETLPPGFQDSVAIGGLTQPTAFRIAPDGRVFVAEESGLIEVFDSLSDPTPTVFADLRTEVYNFGTRGLLGLALDPHFPARPYVYVLYTVDAAIGGTPPRWGTPGESEDPCPTPPGPEEDGCVTGGRLSRLTATGDTMSAEQVLIEDWCGQYPSHSLGDLAFGPDGMLYASAGEGASYSFIDVGQKGNPKNPCGDPPGGVGASQSFPTSEGGALRSQDLLTSGDPAGLDGTVIRVDPDTGAGVPGNPLFSSADPNARRVVADGLRNPFRFAFRPGTSELWMGDVGWGAWEEIDRLEDPTPAQVADYGWPCYEGPSGLGSYANANLCQTLYDAGTSIIPYFSYSHGATVTPGESCPTGSSAVAGTAFAPLTGSTYPTSYRGAFFFADHERKCIWVMSRGGSGLPDRSSVRAFATGAPNPVFLTFGPDGALYYVDFEGGAIRRIGYDWGDQRPTAAIAADPTSGTAPLTVAFHGTGTDPDSGQALSYAWDLNGDGAYDDSASPSPTFTYSTPGTYTARLRVTDEHGASGTAEVLITAGNTPPVPTITAPAGSTTWGVGQALDFSGSASDAQDGALGPGALSWSLLEHHCLDDCPGEVVAQAPGVAAGSFTAPEAPYPSWLELRLTATDSTGAAASASLRLDPRTVNIAFASRPLSGFAVTVDGSSVRTPFRRIVVAGSRHEIGVRSPQMRRGRRYHFGSWSDRGDRWHQVVAHAAATYTAVECRRPSALARSGAKPSHSRCGRAPRAHTRVRR